MGSSQGTIPIDMDDPGYFTSLYFWIKDAWKHCLIFMWFKLLQSLEEVGNIHF